MKAIYDREERSVTEDGRAAHAPTRATGRPLLRAGFLLGALTLALTACVPTQMTDPRTIVPDNDPSVGPAYSGPLVITRGGTYQGNWQSFDPAVPAVMVRTREPVIIENSVVRGRGDLIRGEEANLTLRNTTGYGLNPLTGGAFPGRFLSVYRAVNLVVENNTLRGTSGMYVNLFVGDSAAGQTLKFLRNRVSNVDGRFVTQLGKLTGKRYYVQAIQLNAVNRVPGIEIAWNEIVNAPGQSAVEENISMYESGGTAASPVQIHNNYIDGAYAVRPLNDREYSGGGIMLGDGLQTDMNVVGGYVDVYDNQILRTSNQGIAVAGGHNQRVYGNRIISSGRLPSGEINPHANVGIYVWNSQDRSPQGSATFFNNSVQNNLIGWTRFDSRGQVYYNNLWTPSCLAARGNICKDNQDWPVPISQEVERQELTLWQKKLRDANIVVGVPTTSTTATTLP